MGELPAKWIEKGIGELHDGTSVELEWCGPQLERRPVTDVGSELGTLTQELADALERIERHDALMNRCDLRRPIEDLVRALTMAVPIFRLAEMPRGRRIALAPACNALLNRLGDAELALIAAFGRARAEYMYEITRR